MLRVVGVEVEVIRIVYEGVKCNVMMYIDEREVSDRVVKGVRGVS